MNMADKPASNTGMRSMSDIGVGLVGYGLGGRVFHASFINDTPGMALRAVVSSDPDKVHAQLPDMKVVDSVDALLALPGIDLVVVSSPDDTHAHHAIAALEAGKHVLVDKPFATSLADARKVCAAADRSGTLLTIFHNRRWDADFLTLQRLIANGIFGRIVHLASHFDRWKPATAEVWKEARDGGSWFDLGPHLVDQVVCLFGMPDAVTLDLATMRDGAPAPDWFHAILHYPDKRALLHSSKLCVEHGFRFAVHGTEGSWIKHGLDTQEPAIIAGGSPGDADLGVDPRPGILTRAEAPARHETIANERGDYRLFWQAMVQAIKGEGPNPVPADEALRVMEILEVGLQSAAAGATVRL